MNLKCENIREKILDMLNGSLPYDEIESVNKHIAGCKECSEYSDALREQDELLSKYVANIDADMDLRKQKLLKTIKTSHSNIQTDEPIRRINFTKRLSIALAAAAAIIVVAALSWVYLANNSGTNIEPSPSHIAENHDSSQPEIEPQNTLTDDEIKLAAEKRTIEEMLAARDVDGLVKMLETSQKMSKVLAAQALSQVGDQRAIAALNAINDQISPDVEYNPFAEAIADITERVEIDQNNFDPSTENQNPIANDQSQNKEPDNQPDELLDVDNTTPGVLGLKIVDSDTGKPIVGINIKINSSFGPEINTATDKYGRCEIKYNPDEPLSYLYAYINGSEYVPTRLSFQPARGDTIPLNYNLKLERGTSIGGYVMTPENEPVEGAKIRFYIESNYDNTERIDTSVMYASSDKDGKWHYDRMPEILFNVSITPEHDKYVNAKKYSVGPAIDELRNETAVVYMRTPARITGHIYDLDGDPIANAEVFEGEHMYSNDTRQARADKDGKYVFEKSLYGQTVLTVVAKGFAQDMKVFDVDESTKNVDFYLEPGYSVKVRVVDINGRPLNDVKIEADGWRVIRNYGYAGENIRLSATTDDYGLAIIEDVPSDKVLYTISKNSYATIMELPMLPVEDEYQVTLLPCANITGMVYDAQTNQAIEDFTFIEGICWQGQQKPSWQSHAGKKSIDGKYIQSMKYQTEGYAVKIQADGYAPSETPVFYNEGEDIVYDVGLYRILDEGLLEGTVYLPNGEPAVDAQVGISQINQSLQIKYGVIYNSSALVITTDQDGKFKVPYQSQDYLMVVVHDGGIAEIKRADFEATGAVHLQQWGTLEGTLYIGTQPGSGYGVNLDCSNTSVALGYYINFEYLTKTDKDGKFKFTKVRPGLVNVGRKVQINENTWSYTNQRPVEILPGQTATVELGGGGRRVVGKIEVPGYSTSQMSNLYTIRIRNKKPKVDMSNVELPIIKLPETYFVMNDKEKQAWQTEWVQTEEGQEYVIMATELSNMFESQSQTYPLSFKSDGTFTAEDIPPGEYTIKGSIRELGDTMPESGDLIATINYDFTVPELTEDNEEEPVDIGVVGPAQQTGNAAKILNIGDIAPEFEIQSLKGHPIRLSDFSGKFVILEIGGPMLDHDYINNLAYLKEVYNAYSANGLLEVITACMNYYSYAVDNPFIKPINYLVEQEGIKWTVGFDMIIDNFSPSPESVLSIAYGASLRGSEYTLIAPDGTIAAKNIKPEELMDTVSVAIESLMINQ